MGKDKQKVTYDDLTKKQMNAISYFVNPEIDSITEVAKRTGVSRKTIYEWMDDEQFKQVLNKKIDKYVDSQTAHVWKSLISQAKQGNVQAAKLFFEMQGKYRDRKEISGPDGEPIEINAKEELAKAINRVAEREEV